MNKKGKILRVKTGYNPNSSSMGSLIPTFLFASGVAGMLTVFITTMFQKANKVIKQEKENLKAVNGNKIPDNEI